MKKYPLFIYSLCLFCLCGATDAANYNLEQLWHVTPGSAAYAGLGNFQRGMAYNPVTGHILVVERESVNVYIVSAVDGSVIGTLDMNGLVLGGNDSFKINMISVAEDGAIYVGNLSNSTSSPWYNLYRWESESAVQTPIFYGDPAPGNIQRWGDTMDVRGSGTNTMILLGSRSTAAAIFRPTDETMASFTPTILDVAAPVGASGYSVTFGESNTFWTASGVTSQLVPPPGDPIHVFNFDLNAATATEVAKFSLPPLPAGMAVITVDPTQKLMAGIDIATPDTVNLYSIPNTTDVPVRYSSAEIATTNDNPQFAGAIEIVGDRVYALDQNNGLLAYSIVSTNDVAPEIVAQPVSVTVNTNETATFSAAVQGSTPMFYQWLKGTTNIPNATNSILTIANVQQSAAGNYSLIASNGQGIATSSNAVLVVNGDEPPVPQLLVYEPFDYTPQTLTGLVAPSGEIWGVNGSGDQTQVAPGNLSYPGLAVSAGNCATNGGAGAAARLPLGTNVSAGTLFYSFLMRVDDVGATFTAVNSFVSAFYGTAANAYGLRMTPKAVVGGYQLAVGRAAAGTEFFPTTFTAGETLFIVGSYSYNSSANDDVVKLWINPDPATLGTLTPPDSSLTNSSLGSDIAALDQFTFRQNTSGNTPAAITYDELRIGITWADVTPVSAPVAPSLNVTLSNSTVVISWPTNATGFNLESAPNLNSPVAWSAVTNSVIPDGSNNTVSVVATNAGQFFRLKQ